MPETSSPVGRRTGSVKWFNAEKAFGMITPDDGGPDVYVHYSAVESSAGSFLAEGERVEFATERGRSGLEARQVRSL